MPRPLLRPNPIRRAWSGGLLAPRSRGFLTPDPGWLWATFSRWARAAFSGCGRSVFSGCSRAAFSGCSRAAFSGCSRAAFSGYGRSVFSGWVRGGFLTLGRASGDGAQARGKASMRAWAPSPEALAWRPVTAKWWVPHCWLPVGPGGHLRLSGLATALAVTRRNPGQAGQPEWWARRRTAPPCAQNHPARVGAPPVAACPVVGPGSLGRGSAATSRRLVSRAPRPGQAPGPARSTANAHVQAP